MKDIELIFVIFDPLIIVILLFAYYALFFS